MLALYHCQVYLSRVLHSLLGILYDCTKRYAYQTPLYAKMTTKRKKIPEESFLGERSYFVFFKLHRMGAIRFALVLSKFQLL